MKILQVHNRYQQSGGEDSVVAAEFRMLTDRGHQVEQWIEDNREISAWSAARKLRVGLQSAWSWDSYRETKARLGGFKPDIVHVHNTVPIITSSVYSAARAMKVPVVQTIHNYRFFCASGLLLREDRICEDCLHKVFPYPAVVHKCYRGSRAQSLAMAAVTSFHQLAGTYRDKVDCFIALTEFAKGKMVDAGLPASKVVVKPNFAAPAEDPASLPGSYVLFAGRLVGGKGVRELVAAWKKVSSATVLKIVGEGELKEEIRRDLPRNIELLGWKKADEVLDLMRHAKFLVLPSKWYEGFPMTIVESFSVGLPVLASDLGSMREIILSGGAGWVYDPRDPDALSGEIARILDNRLYEGAIRKRALETWRTHYSEDINYKALMGIYASLAPGSTVPRRGNQVG